MAVGNNGDSSVGLPVAIAAVDVPNQPPPPSALPPLPTNVPGVGKELRATFDELCAMTHRSPSKEVDRCIEALGQGGDALVPLIAAAFEQRDDFALRSRLIAVLKGINTEESCRALLTIALGSNSMSATRQQAAEFYAKADIRIAPIVELLRSKEPAIQRVAMIAVRPRGEYDAATTDRLLELRRTGKPDMRLAVASVFSAAPDDANRRRAMEMTLRDAVAAPSWPGADEPANGWRLSQGYTCGESWRELCIQGLRGMPEAIAGFRGVSRGDKTQDQVMTFATMLTVRESDPATTAAMWECIGREDSGMLARLAIEVIGIVGSAEDVEKLEALAKTSTFARQFRTSPKADVQTVHPLRGPAKANASLLKQRLAYRAGALNR